MITLDPEFVGTIAPPSKLTTTVDGKIETPFARLPRHERLKVQGKADQTEDLSDEDEDSGDNDATKAEKREEKEKKKMRGRGKALKRYLRKQRKNVIDPRAVCYLLFRMTWIATFFLGRCACKT